MDSDIELVKDETPKEVNLDEYLNDLNVLLEIEDDETKRLELAEKKANIFKDFLNKL